MVDSWVLDLFAGSGAFGCEALSRGAAAVFFVDNSGASLDLIKQNSTLVPGGPDKTKIIKADLSRGFPGSCLSRLEGFSFDLVFADPPYLTELSLKILSALDKCSVLSSNPLIIIEERKNFVAPERLRRLRL